MYFYLTLLVTIFASPLVGAPQEVVIIGSGPAGLTAALYAARADLAPLVIEGVESGGQLLLTTDVENYPGFDEGVLGPDLVDRMRRQAKRFGTSFCRGDVTKVDLSVYPYRLHLGSSIIETKSLIIATGASARWLGVPGEKRLMGHGVSACATCDAFFYRDKKVVVVGGGDSAMEEALHLAKFASEVVVLHRRDHFRASPIMAERVRNHPKISILWNSVVKEVCGESEVEGLQVENLVTGKEELLPTDGLFVAIGHTPNTSLFEESLERNEQGYLKPVMGGRMALSQPGVFAAGDVADSYYRQAITAAASGCMAALEAQHWLERQE